YPAEYTVGYKSGPRAAVLIDTSENDKALAYSLGGMGHLHCLDAKTGKVIWKRDLATEYDIEMPRWGIAASPLIEGDLLFLQIGGKPVSLPSTNTQGKSVGGPSMMMPVI
ncbi:MAG: hypothetical protein P8L44_06025, partial [Opitutales bacterium]|nr:hypothetical protein [Opitutales bacterium]